MAYDEELAARIRDEVGDEPGVTERRMFGGLAYLVNGNMAVAASGQDGMLLRVDLADTDALACSVPTEQALEEWVRRGLAYARSLPPE